MSLRKRRPGLVYPINEDWHYVGATDEPAFDNTWVNFGSTAAALGFRIRETGIVDIQGVVKDGTGTVVFTLPVGYRPASTVQVPAVIYDSSNTHQAAVLVVSPSGPVSVYREDATVPVNGDIAFLYAQVFLTPPAPP